MNKPALTSHSAGDAPTTEPPRRNFLLEFAAVLIGAIVTVIPAVAGALFVFNPLYKRKESNAEGSGDGFRKVGLTTQLSGDGTPTMFRVTGSKKDAWTTYPEAALGAVYVWSQEGDVHCLNARCPHLGCTVNFNGDNESFVCPCHDSSFNMQGDRSNEIPPRNMDPLDVEIRNDNELWVRFQNFRAGTSERHPV